LTYLRIEMAKVIAPDYFSATSGVLIKRPALSKEFKLGRKKALSKVDAILALLPGWRSIETAPKDGTKFDVWYPSNDAAVPTPAHRVTDVYWSDVQSDFCTDGSYGPEEPSPLMLHPRPTHWQPLPPAPST